MECIMQHFVQQPACSAPRHGTAKTPEKWTTLGPPRRAAKWVIDSEPGHHSWGCGTKCCLIYSVNSTRWAAPRNQRAHCRLVSPPRSGVWEPGKCCWIHSINHPSTKLWIYILHMSYVISQSYCHMSYQTGQSDSYFCFDLHLWNFELLIWF